MDGNQVAEEGLCVECGGMWMAMVGVAESYKGFVAGGESHADAMEIMCLKDMIWFLCNHIREHTLDQRFSTWELRPLGGVK